MTFDKKKPKRKSQPSPLIILIIYMTVIYNSNTVSALPTKPGPAPKNPPATKAPSTNAPSTTQSSTSSSVGNSTAAVNTTSSVNGTVSSGNKTIGGGGGGGGGGNSSSGVISGGGGAGGNTTINGTKPGMNRTDVNGNSTSINGKSSLNATSTLNSNQTLNQNQTTGWNMSSNGTSPTNYTLNTTQVITTTTPVTTTTEKIEVPVINSTCIGKEAWNQEIYEKGIDCLAHICAEYMLDIFDVYMKCNDWSEPTEVQIIGGYLNKYFSLRAADMINLNNRNPVKRTSTSRKREYYDIEYGYIRTRFLRQSQEIVFPRPTVSNMQRFLLPPTLMEDEIVAYVFMEYDLKIYDPKVAVEFAEFETPQTYAIFVLDGKQKTKGVEFVLNSKIVSLTTRPRLKTNGEFVDITFEYRDFKGTLNHKCVSSLGHLGKLGWTDKGCFAISITKKDIHCKCSYAEGNFAVVSELIVEPPPPPPFKQEDTTFALVIICIIGIVVCLLCLMLPFCVGCSHIAGMIRIYRYSDMTQALEYAVFIIGVYANRHLTTSSLIAVILHFLHCAVIFWAIVEGIYLYHKIRPIYHDRIGMMFFYSTVTFGITAALTGSLSGFTFDFGINEQYIWVKTSGDGLIYFLIPIGLLVLTIIIIDYLLIMVIKNWIGFHNDYVYMRSTPFIYRQSGFVGVCIVTFFIGNMSMSKGGKGYTVYLFGAFFVIQFLCRFYSHFVWNYEVWDWKKYTDAQKVAAKYEEEVELENENRDLIKGVGETSGFHEEYESSECESIDEDAMITDVDRIDDDTMMNRHMLGYNVALSPTESVSTDKYVGILGDGVENPAYDDHSDVDEEISEIDENYNDQTEEEETEDENEEEEDAEKNEEDEYESDGEGGKRKKERKGFIEPPPREKFKKPKKPKLVPRLTKAALARMQMHDDKK